jgi:hypothetical protein
MFTWLIIIVGIILYARYRQKKQKNASNARKPIRISTKLSTHKIKEILNNQLPDSHHKISGWLGDPLGKNNGLICAVKPIPEHPDWLNFGIMGSGGLLGTIRVTLIDGSKEDCIVTFSIAIIPSKNDQGKIEAWFITTKWSEKNGIFNKYKDLITAQNKFAQIITKEDDQADISRQDLFKMS